MKKFFVFAACALLLAGVAAAQNAEQVVGQIFGSFQHGLPNVPAEFWEEARANIDTTELTEKLVAIYNDSYTREEIEGFIEFYESELGQKLLDTEPQVLQESIFKAQQWGNAIARNLQQKLQEAGHLQQQQPQGPVGPQMPQPQQ